VIEPVYLKGDNVPRGAEKLEPTVGAHIDQKFQNICFGH